MLPQFVQMELFTFASIDCRLRWLGQKLGKKRGKHRCCINLYRWSRLRLRPQIVAYAGLARKLASSAENIDVASNFAAGAI
jgi:hypothetical protein